MFWIFGPDTHNIRTLSLTNQMYLYLFWNWPEKITKTSLPLSKAGANKSLYFQTMCIFFIYIQLCGNIIWLLSQSIDPADEIWPYRWMLWSSPEKGNLMIGTFLLTLASQWQVIWHSPYKRHLSTLSEFLFI